MVERLIHCEAICHSQPSFPVISYLPGMMTAGGESVESFPLGRRQRTVKGVEGRAEGLQGRQTCRHHILRLRAVRGLHEIERAARVA